MTRGTNNGTSSENAVYELFGGIKQQIIFFAAETGLSAGWIAERISALLSPSGERVHNKLPPVRREAPDLRGAVEPVEVAVDAHSLEAPPPVAAKRKSGKQAAYWARMNTAERAAEMARRLQKRKKLKPYQKKQLKSLQATAGSKAPKKGRTPETEKAKKGRTPKAVKKTPHYRDTVEGIEKQRIYVARALAKKNGLPLPPLPSESTRQQSAA
jgi:hypothetical protein